MDEYWRMRMGMGMGMPSLFGQRSTDHSFDRSVYSAASTLNADDFSDVFGGPPRSVLSGQISGGFGLKQSDIFYEEVFRSSEFVSRGNNGGRSLPAFRIPAKEDAFYSDIFGSDSERRSIERSGMNSKAKSNSSSALSSEELSPLRSTIGNDVMFSAFASKLRPINVPCGWNSERKVPEEPQRKQERPAFRPNSSENQFVGCDFMESFRSPYYGFSRHVSSPETISEERPNSYQSNKVSAGDAEVNSVSSSVASSLCRVPENKAATRGRGVPEDEDEDEVESSYVIEINSDYREGSREREAVDEAIAWAKQMFQRHPSETNLSSNLRESELGEGGSMAEQQLNQTGTRQVLEEEAERSRSGEERKAELENDKTMKTLDEDINLWSAGKQTNIRLLLSTLHHILWPNSGWHPTSLTSLIGTSQVKKAYQKARLCLHPDKLQQRGATQPQKYVAQKAFSILQDAWATFISQNVF